MKAVYIASPYTKGDVAVNVKAQIDCADELITLGFAPFVPLYSHFQHMQHPRPYEDWTRLDNEWVLRCDYLLRLEGESIGADAEVELAIKNNIPVFYSIGELTAANKACSRRGLLSPIERDWSGKVEDEAWAYLQKPPRR